MPNKKKKDNIRLSIEKEWPSAKAFGTILPNYMITPDSTFTRLKTGAGDIEYFNEPSINYGSEDSPNIILNPNGNIPTLLYSPLNNSVDDVKLDLLHHYRLYDPVYLDLLQDYTSTLNKSEILWNSLLGDLFRSKYPDTYNKHWKEWDALVNSTPDNSLYMVLGIDGSLRNLLAKEETIKKSNYAPREEAILQYLNTPKAQQAFNNIQLYLESSRLPEVIVTPNSHADGGKLSTPLDWNALTMKEKAAYIRMGVANGYKDINSIRLVYNEFQKGGYLYGGGGGIKNTRSTPDNWYMKHKDKWETFLIAQGLSNKDADRLSGFFAALDGLESGNGTSSAARNGNNYGGMQRNGKNIVYKSIYDYMADKWKMMNTRFTPALQAKSILEYGTILGDPARADKSYLYYVADGYNSKDPLNKLWVANQKAHMNNYIRGMESYYGKSNRNILPLKDLNNTIYFRNPTKQPVDNKRVANISIPTPAKPLLNTALDSNIPTDLIVMQLEEPVVDKLIPEVVVTALAPRQYVMPNPQELLALMNSMMVPYELPEIPKPITATERLALLNKDRNTLLLQDLEDSILRANRLGTPLDEVKLARDVKDLQFYRNMAADGGTLFEDGGSKEYIAQHPLLDEVVVTAPRKYFVRYDEDGNPIYTEDYALSQEAITNSLPEDPEVTKRKQAVIDIKNRPAGKLTGTAKTMANMAELGIGAALAPIAAAPLVEGIAPALQGAWNAASPYVTPYIQGALKFGLSPVSSIAEGVSNYVPQIATQVSKALPYLQAAEKTGWGLSGAMGLYNNAKDLINGDKHWANALAEGALEGMMMTEVGPVAKLGYNLAKQGYNVAEDASATALGNNPIVKRALEAAALTADINPWPGIKDYFKNGYFMGKNLVNLPYESNHFKNTIKYILTGKGNSKDAYFAPEGFGFERANGDKDGYLRALLYGEEPGTDLTKLGTAADIPIGEHLQTLLDRGYKPEQIRVYSTNMPGRGKYLSPNLEELNLHIANMDYTSRATDNSLPTANGNFDAAGHRIFDVRHGLDVNQMELDFTDFNTTAYGKKWLHSDVHINPFLKFGLKVMDKATTPIIVRTKWGSRFPSQQGQIMTEPSEILDSKDWEHFKDMLNSDMSAWENLLFMNNNINTSLLKKYTGYELPYNLTKKSWFRR